MFIILYLLFVFLNNNVHKLYKEVLNAHFSPDEIVTFNAVETNKNIQSVLDLCDKVMDFAAKKNMNIILNFLLLHIMIKIHY